MKLLFFFLAFGLLMIGVAGQLITGWNIWWNIVGLYFTVALLLVSIERLFPVQYTDPVKEHFSQARASALSKLHLSLLFLCAAHWGSQWMAFMVEWGALFVTLFSAVFGLMYLVGVASGFFGMLDWIAWKSMLDEIEARHLKGRDQWMRREWTE
jgi:hypothetical protein